MNNSKKGFILRNNSISNRGIKNIKLILFLVALFGGLGLYMILEPIVIKETYGPDVKQQVEKQFSESLKQQYDCLFIGSSEIYHGINPDKLSVPSYNFGFGGETLNQEWYKLRYLEKNNKQFKYLVLGLDFSDFSVFQNERNHAYRDYFDEEYFQDYNEISTISETNDYFNQYVTGHYIDKLPQFIRGLGRILLLGKDKSKGIEFYGNLKDNGQMVYPNVLGMKESTKYVIKDLPHKLKIQERYFDEIIKYTQNKNIRLIIVVPPKYRSYDAKITKEYEQYFKEKLKGTNATYLNYQDNVAFTHSDFYDDTHLTEAGADKFTKIMDEQLKKLEMKQ